MKYQPKFPEGFGAIEDSLDFGQTFFTWYNQEHHHSGIATLTLEMLHYGMAAEVIGQREQVLDAAYARNPDTLHPRPTNASVRANRGLDQPTNSDHREEGNPH